MGRITITMEVYDEHADEQDGTGVTNETFEHIQRWLGDIGDDINVERD